MPSLRGDLTTVIPRFPTAKHARENSGIMLDNVRDGWPPAHISSLRQRPVRSKPTPQTGKSKTLPHLL